MITYNVSFEKANAHLFDVSLKIASPLKAGQAFYLPNWIPGSYMIRDFAKNIVQLNALCGEQVIRLVKNNKSKWLLEQDVEQLTINYQVYAWDLSVRSAHLDNQHGFFNGTSLFLGVAGFEDTKHQLTLKTSKIAQQNKWRVATAASKRGVDEYGFGDYQSNSYHELIDHPFEMGVLESCEFDVFGVPHQMYFTEAPARVDWQRIADDVKKICEAEVEFFGEKKPPFDNYVFMTFVQKKGFGGLEHMASTALHCSFKDLPLVGENREKMSPEYRLFLTLCCHEYFHNWNVKRIKPARFIPMDLSQEVHTELLWFFEGVTSYYDELLMARAGVIEPSSYLDLLAQMITKVVRGEGHLNQTLAESSFDAWTKFYQQDENAVNSIVSYYTKGALIAFCLDFEIRQLTSNAKSLDDLMRVIWRDFGKKGIGLGETQVQILAEELVGQSMQDFFARALYSTQLPDLGKIFNFLDIHYQIIPQYIQAETGGFVSKAKNRKSVSFLGITHKESSAGAEIVSVFQSGCAASAGLSSGDNIIAIDDIRVNSAELDKLIAKIPLSTKIKVSFFRRERLYHVECQLTAAKANTCYLSYLNEKPGKALENWINGHD